MEKILWTFIDESKLLDGINQKIKLEIFKQENGYIVEIDCKFIKIFDYIKNDFDECGKFYEIIAEIQPVNGVNKKGFFKIYLNSEKYIPLFYSFKNKQYIKFIEREKMENLSGDNLALYVE